MEWMPPRGNHLGQQAMGGQMPMHKPMYGSSMMGQAPMMQQGGMPMTGSQRMPYQVGPQQQMAPGIRAPQMPQGGYQSKGNPMGAPMFPGGFGGLRRY